MKKALVMGITGGFGGHVATSLANDGWQIKALMRNPEKLPEKFHAHEVIKGDAANRHDIEKAATGVDVIIYGVNPANYAWDGVVMPLLENVASVAEAKKLTIVFPGNIYVYNPDDGPYYSEATTHHPVSSKGVMREEMEKRLKKASIQGAQVIIFRMGDFIGEGANSTWLKQILKITKKGYVLSATGPRTLKHSWANLPDAANAISMLLNKRRQLNSFNEFNFKGYQVSFNDISTAIEEATQRKVIIKNFPWFIIKLIMPFSALFKGLLEMRYLWDREINLDDEKLTKELEGNIPHTTLSQALIESGVLS